VNWDPNKVRHAVIAIVLLLAARAAVVGGDAPPEPVAVDAVATDTVAVELIASERDAVKSRPEPVLITTAVPAP